MRHRARAQISLVSLVSKKSGDGKEAVDTQLLTGWYHREAPGTALQGLLGTQYT